MAGDWIKVEHSLSEKPEVIATAARLNVDPDLIVGKLFRMWRWFDNHTVDGRAPGVTTAFIDRHVELEGFAAALTAVNWLGHRNGSLAVPNFDRHCSKSAKERALAAARLKRARYAAAVTNPQPDNNSDSRSPSRSRSCSGKHPTIEEVRAYFSEVGTAIDPDEFWAHYDANGWVQGTAKKPIRNWKSCLTTWEKNAKKQELFNGRTETNRVGPGQRYQG